MLKFKIDTLDGLDEGLHDYYEEAESGGYQLKVDGLEDTGALKRAKDHEKQARKEAEQAAKELKDRLAELEAKLEEGGRASAKDKGDIEALEKSYQEKIGKLEKGYQEKIDGLQGNLQRILVDSQAETLASELAVQGSASVLVPHIRSRLSVEERDGEFKTVVLDAEGKPSALDLNDLKQEITANSAYAPIIVGSKASGSGASGGGSGGAAQQSVTREQWESMSHVDRAAFSKGGGKVIDP